MAQFDSGNATGSIDIDIPPRPPMLLPLFYGFIFHSEDSLFSGGLQR